MMTDEQLLTIALKYWRYGEVPIAHRAFARAVLAAAQPAPVPPGWRLVPVEPTQEMLAAYLAANTEYWKEVDAKPFDVTKKWRQGTPSDATRESYKAMLAAFTEVPK